MKRNKILISIWSDPSMYINLMFLINYLLDKNYEIILVCKKIDNIKDFNFFVKKNSNLFVRQTNLDGRLGYLKFFFLKFSYLIKKTPKIIISINFISLFFTFFLPSKKIKLIYYNFDFDLKKKYNNLIEKNLIKKFHYVILPSKSRLNLYKNKFKRKNNIFFLNNCFSKRFKINKFKNDYKYNKIKYLVRLGSFSSSHALKEIALSTKYWKNNIYLIMAGKSYDGYFEELKKFIKIKKLNKIKLYKNINYHKWFKFLANAIAGFALYDPVNTSHNHMGGTSQKLNNYIFCNLPSIITKNKDFNSFNKKYKTSKTVDNNYKEIAKCVNKIINNKKLYIKLKNNNKNAFEKEFNFEKQIEKIKKIFI